MTLLRYCTTCEQPVPTTHTHKRFTNGSTWQWRKQRAAVLKRDGYRCTEMIYTGGRIRCPARATEVHHVNDRELRSVCQDHNPRGG